MTNDPNGFNTFKPLVSKESKYSWYVQDTRLPEFLCNEINEYFESTVTPRPGEDRGKIKDYRKVDARWCHTADWVASFMWGYIDRINRENFEYDLTCLAFHEVHHLTYYPGYQYGWHQDDVLMTATRPGPVSWEGIDLLNQEYVRKLSFSLQLSHPDEYTGGGVQLIEQPATSWIMPKERGTLCVFDSRTTHRVLPIKTGVRKCLVGWALGPKWR